jgi:hypothetical protein
MAAPPFYSLFFFGIGLTQLPTGVRSANHPMIATNLGLSMLLIALMAPKRQITVAFCPARHCTLFQRTIRPWSSSSDSTSEEMITVGDSVSSISNDPLAAFRNTNNRRDQVFSAISGRGGIKVTVATVRNIVNDMSLQHTMTPVSTDALGRTIVCGLLMANGIQQEQAVQITINGASVWDDSVVAGDET